MEKEKTESDKVSKWLNNISQLAEKSPLLLKNIFEKRLPSSALFQMVYFQQIYQQFLQHLLRKPEKLIEIQLTYWQQLFFIWQRYWLDYNGKLHDIFGFVKD